MAISTAAGVPWPLDVGHQDAPLIVWHAAEKVVIISAGMARGFVVNGQVEGRECWARSDGGSDF